MGIAHGCWKACEPRGRSSLRRLQHRLELARIAALDKEAVRILAVGQRDQRSSDASFPESSREVLCRVLAAAVTVGIKGNIDGSASVAELPKLARIEMGSQ